MVEETGVEPYVHLIKSMSYKDSQQVAGIDCAFSLGVKMQYAYR